MSNQPLGINKNEFNTTERTIQEDKFGNMLQPHRSYI
jgi:hypothetical protein